MKKRSPKNKNGMNYFKKLGNLSPHWTESDILFIHGRRKGTTLPLKVTFILEAPQYQVCQSPSCSTCSTTKCSKIASGIRSALFLNLPYFPFSATHCGSYF